MTAQKTKIIIPAVAYCRKSTKEEGHEKSLADQKARIEKLQPSDENSEYKIVKWYAKDAGVPGWKRGASRPDYHKLVNELRETGAKCILVDDMDRFSRSDPMETLSDVQSLRESGVQKIHAVNQGCKDLVAGGPAVAMMIAVEANGSHEFSTKLSRRISHARRDAAANGKRTGGPAPYGLANDGHGGLNFGDSKQIKTVRWIFDQFVNGCKSMNSISGELNGENISSSKGGKWYTVTIKSLLQQRAYCGDFVYNKKRVVNFISSTPRKKSSPLVITMRTSPSPGKRQVKASSRRKMYTNR